MNSSFKLHKKIANFCSFRVICCGYVFDGDQVVSAFVQQTSKGPRLRFFDRNAPSSHEHAYMQNESKDTTYIGVALPSSVTLMRSLTLPPLPSKEVDPAIHDLLEQSLAVNLEEAVAVYEFAGKDETTTAVTAFVSRKSDVEETLLKAEKYGIDPHLIVPKAVALARFMEHFELSLWQLLIDIDDQEISYVLLHNYRTVESRVIPGNAGTFSGEIENLPKSQLENTLQRILETTNAFKERYELPKDTPLTVTGKACSLKLIPELISEYVQAPLSTLHELEASSDCLAYAAAIGTAFCCNPESKELATSNFRKNDFCHKSPLLHWKRPLISFALSSLLIAAAILWHGFSSHTAIVEQMKQDWTSMLTTAHMDEKAFKDAHPDLTATTPDDIVSSADALLTHVSNQALFPLSPNIPQVKDLFTWLSMQIGDVQKKISDTTAFEIQQIRYNLVKYPCKKSPKEHYQVHIAIEFNTSSVALARAFHEHLIQRCPFVKDPSEVTWTPGAGKYKIAFFAKDRTPYPTNIS